MMIKNTLCLAVRRFIILQHPSSSSSFFFFFFSLLFISTQHPPSLPFFFNMLLQYQYSSTLSFLFVSPSSQSGQPNLCCLQLRQIFTRKNKFIFISRKVVKIFASADFDRFVRSWCRLKAFFHSIWE